MQDANFNWNCKFVYNVINFTFHLNCISNINPILKRELYLSSLLYSDRLSPNELILAGKGIRGDIADAQKGEKLAGASLLTQS